MLCASVSPCIKWGCWCLKTDSEEHDEEKHVFCFFFLKSALKFLDERYCQHSKHYLRKTPNCFTYVYRLTSWKHNCSEKIHPSCLTSSPHTNDLQEYQWTLMPSRRAGCTGYRVFPFLSNTCRQRKRGRFCQGTISQQLWQKAAKSLDWCAHDFICILISVISLKARVVSAKYPWSTEGCQVELPRAACLVRTATAAQPVHP